MSETLSAAAVTEQEEDERDLTLKEVETILRDGSAYCQEKQARQVVEFVYNAVIETPKVLNRYAPFSAETYGETTLNQMKIILDQLQITEDDVFVDLGSGVGQLVLFTAAYTRAKTVVGIELAKTPAKFATEMGELFETIMNAEGKEHGDIQLHHGNILDYKYRDLICQDATVIFINNMLFDPKLKMIVEEKLLKKLRPGTRLITTEPLGYRKRLITKRNEHDLSSMLTCSRLNSFHGNVSWSNKKVQYHLSTVDHTELLEFRAAHAAECEARNLRIAEKRRTRKRAAKHIETTSREAVKTKKLHV